MAQRILFLCARDSSRAVLAASIFAAKADNGWEIWSTPPQDVHGRTLAEQVLFEQGMELIASDHLIKPAFGMQWDEGVILCSGEADT